jgi:hypothetical protein
LDAGSSLGTLGFELVISTTAPTITAIAMMVRAEIASPAS